MNRPDIGSCWFVENISEMYVGRVIGYERDRILIVNDDLPPNIRQTATLASLESFDFGDGRGKFILLESA